MSDYIENLNWRYATKLFDADKKLTKEQRELLEETLSLAPSSFGLQPYVFVNVQDKKTKEKLQEAAWNQVQVTTCSDLFVLCAKTNINQESVVEYIELVSQTRKVSRKTLSVYEEMMTGFVQGTDDDKKMEWAKNQVYIALGFLLDAAAQNGIDACPMEGFDSKEFDKILKLPEKNLTSVVVCPVGFRSDVDKYKHMAKVRKPKEDIIITI